LALAMDLSLSLDPLPPRPVAPARGVGRLPYAAARPPIRAMISSAICTGTASYRAN